MVSGHEKLDCGPVSREWVSGSLMLVRRSCVLDLGGFDSRYGSYVEDVDICLRAHDAGWTVAVDCSAYAKQKGSSSRSVTRMVDVNSVLLVAKRGTLKSPIMNCVIVNLVIILVHFMPIGIHVNPSAAGHG